MLQLPDRSIPTLTAEARCACSLQAAKHSYVSWLCTRARTLAAMLTAAVALDRAWPASCPQAKNTCCCILEAAYASTVAFWCLCLT